LSEGRNDGFSSNGMYDMYLVIVFNKFFLFFTERKNSVQEEKKTRSKYDPVVREASPPPPQLKNTHKS